ncbi:Om14p KNAG_0M00720 [Huiozyma naganishii CBS 8797]|uniref:Mitochondrial outer membrane protein OM14 C-terminal domain-containing protein n=1 Tax=Huiozyma naganishii (strain ATCC MYA-139 / BCRC 22969 / CBS 8797 / KCTC 17520 / NBRC 10181 / NCYC 3082 / Yp74L-3) TaxID=1071383 RepID=J7RDH0_HUIN7|nr:hypothetical protein KNAG_0M00720 [Kazachstania naganishii CBS 8797]CCK72925.1 hypothetical protein KNAG_0M00720 [Kazachstania naganishii CBS 8797]
MSESKDPINQTTRIEQPLGDSPVDIPSDQTPENGAGEKRCGSACPAVLCAVWDRTKQFAVASSKTVCHKTTGFAATVCTALKNPVVAVNTLLGVSLLSAVLVGYVKDKRFIQGKSPREIWGATAGAVALLTVDGLLSKKYSK